MTRQQGDTFHQKSAMPVRTDRDFIFFQLAPPKTAKIKDRLYRSFHFDAMLVVISPASSRVTLNHLYELSKISAATSRSFDSDFEMACSGGS